MDYSWFHLSHRVQCFWIIFLGISSGFLSMINYIKSCVYFGYYQTAQHLFLSLLLPFQKKNSKQTSPPFFPGTEERTWYFYVNCKAQSLGDHAQRQLLTYPHMDAMKKREQHFPCAVYLGLLLYVNACSYLPSTFGGENWSPHLQRAVAKGVCLALYLIPCLH